MSTQSIIHSNKSLLSENTDLAFIKMSDSYLMDRKFSIGNGYSRKDFNELYWLSRLLCTDNCDLHDYNKVIREKINLIILKYT